MSTRSGPLKGPDKAEGDTRLPESGTSGEGLCITPLFTGRGRRCTPNHAHQLAPLTGMPPSRPGFHAKMTDKKLNAAINNFTPPSSCGVQGPLFVIADCPMSADPNRNTSTRVREKESEVRTDSIQGPNHTKSEALFLETAERETSCQRFDELGAALAALPREIWSEHDSNRFTGCPRCIALLL